MIFRIKEKGERRGENSKQKLENDKMRMTNGMTMRMTLNSIYRQRIFVIPSVIMTWYDRFKLIMTKIMTIMTEVISVIPSVIMELNRLLFHYDTY